MIVYWVDGRETEREFFCFWLPVDMHLSVDLSMSSNNGLFLVHFASIQSEYKIQPLVKLFKITRNSEAVQPVTTWRVNSWRKILFVIFSVRQIVFDLFGHQVQLYTNLVRD